MSKFTIRAIIALLEIILQLLSKIIRLVDTIRDLLDDKELNGSISYASDALDSFRENIESWLNTIIKDVEDIKHDLE